jgi:dTDP-4-amino-4,6-dideoxygalactose transaminase
MTDAEIILPAYGCPDLVSAVEHAGARPVLVDMEPERPWMDLEQVASRISAATAAIVAVSLFGIPERMGPLRKLAERHSIVLIEDSAQAFPVAGEHDFWSGDLVVLSFGRGKPVSLLGGGAVLYRKSGPGLRLPEPPAGRSGRLHLRAKAALYNLLSAPRYYWILRGLPFLHLGETRYVPLPEISAMASATRDLLGENIVVYQMDNRDIRARLAAMLATLADAGTGFVNLPVACQTPARRRLLRYPLLVDRACRDTCLERLQQRGLGASSMYPSVLPDIRGLEQPLAGQGDFPVAEDFASRILTLPTHRRVTDVDIDKMGQILRSCVH